LGQLVMFMGNWDSWWCSWAIGTAGGVHGQLGQLEPSQALEPIC